MTLLQEMRRHRAEAQDRGVTADHWQVTPDALVRLRRETTPAELSGSDVHGEWMLDGLALRESDRAFTGDFRLVSVMPR